MSQTISAQPISVSIQMDAQGFRDFAVFDVFHHRKSWVRPTIFAVIMLAFAGVCLSQIGKRPGAALLTVVLALVGIGLPASYFGAYFYSLAQQVKKMHFPRARFRTSSRCRAFRVERCSAMACFMRLKVPVSWPTSSPLCTGRSAPV